MKEQIDKLSRKLKMQLGKRIIRDDRNTQDELTKDELVLIEELITIASFKNYKLPMVIKISSRYHLDFIWWAEGIDVLLCKNHK